MQAVAFNTGIEATAGETLIFLDEIQQCPEAINGLRYFYEQYPGLHIIAAGSLLDFVLDNKEARVPVGRVEYFQMQPMSFKEFLLAQHKKQYIDYIESITLSDKSNPVIHQQLLDEVKKYFLVGGLPEAVQSFTREEYGYASARQAQQRLIQAYLLDFGRYAKYTYHDDIEAVFNYIPANLSKKFVYSHVYPEAKNRNIRIALDLLVKAGLVNLVRASSPQLPLAAGASVKNFKTIFLDIGLVSTKLGYDMNFIYAEDIFATANGGLAEQFVGQELIASEAPYATKELFYWHKDSPSSSAEIDYLKASAGAVVPIEVKFGSTGRLKSLRIFMERYKTRVGLRISQNELSQHGDLLSLPFYLVSELERLLGGLVLASW